MVSIIAMASLAMELSLAHPLFEQGANTFRDPRFDTHPRGCVRPDVTPGA